MDATQPEPGGLLARAKQVLRTLADFGQARVELFLVELHEERLRMFEALLLLAICVVCLLMTLAVLTFALVAFFWQEHRGLVLLLLTLAYATGAGASYWELRRRLVRWQVFTASLDQLKKDRACLEKQS